MFARLKVPSLLFLAIMFLFTGMVLSGCGSKKTSQAPAQVTVKAMQVVVKDTPIIEGFVGEVVAKDEVELKANVSGKIIDKMVEGGATVRRGQPLFQIDRRDYEAALLNKKANLAQAQSELSDTRLDVERYKYLAERDAVSRQLLEQTLNKEQQKIALVESNRALLAQAQNDLDDTLIVSPIDGTVKLDNLGIGNFVQAGQTVLAVISSLNPIHVKFSLSENKYLEFFARHKETWEHPSEAELKIILSDGSVYPLPGKIVQAERAVSGKTGTISLKASFDNPYEVLVPGMFARVSAVGNVRKGALLIPQKAIQETLGKDFVTVAVSTPEGDKAESRAVKLGPKYEDFQVVEEGIGASDRVIVEGLTKVKPGTLLQVVIIEPDELNAPAIK